MVLYYLATILILYTLGKWGYIYMGNYNVLSQTLMAGTSLEVQWLRLCALNAGGMGLIPGQGTKIPHAAWCGLINKQTNRQKTLNG